MELRKPTRAQKSGRKQTKLRPTCYLLEHRFECDTKRQKGTRSETPKTAVRRLSQWIKCIFSWISLVPMEGVEPTHPFEYQILSLARLPIPPHRRLVNQVMRRQDTNSDSPTQARWAGRLGPR